MKIHTLFVEPANYTQDLIENVYQRLGISYSFLNSNSAATNDNTIVASAKHLFDESSVWQNIVFLWNCSKENELVIINGYNHMPFIIMWLFSIVNSCTIGVESDTPYRPKTGIKGMVKKIYLNFIFSNKQIVGLPGGTGLHRDLFLKYGMPENRIFFLPMMVSNAKYFAIKHVETLNNNPLKFIFVGRLAPEKNIQLLIKSFQTVLKQHKNVELNLIGDGEDKAELKKMIAMTPQIKLLGKKFGSDLLQAYQGAQILILPSSFEPWGLVVNEAMAAGLPVVCSSAVGASHDLVLKPNTGWVFKNNDERELTALLLNIIDHPKQIKEKAKRGQEFMLNYWNYDLYIKSLNQLINYVRKD
ncbi:MAG: glycosyltransferase family 4 protein [Lutibacter sp.]|nr:glycosyltransferase family 4 protein [Lutibacter sp.]